jgi:Tfp pilus assembly protein PilE
MHARKGFTLLEILLIFVILAILGLITSIALKPSQKKSATPNAVAISDLPADTRVERYGKTLGSEVARAEVGDIVEIKNEGFLILASHREKTILITNTIQNFVATPDEVIRIIHRSDSDYGQTISIIIRKTHDLATTQPAP